MRPLFASLAMLVMHPVAHAEPIDLDQMIAAMAQVEGGAWGKPGGTCCMNYSAWSQHSNLPFQASMIAETALPVYRLHLEWVLYNLPKHRVRVTPAAVYLCWRRGLEGAVAILRKHPMPDEAVRCQNLYEDADRH